MRRQIGVAAKDSTRHPDNIMENIIGTGEQLTIDDAWRAARLAAVDRHIAAMPIGMFTFVGDRSATFSGGQMQRIKTAVASVRNPRIVTDYQVTLDSSSASFGSGGSDASYDRAGFIVRLGDDVPPDLDVQLRGALPSGGNVTARVFADRSGPSGGDATFTLTGSRYEDVRAVTNRLYAALEGDPGIRNLRSNIVDGTEEFTVVIDPDAAGRHGLSTLEVANQIRAWVSGSGCGHTSHASLSSAGEG